MRPDEIRAHLRKEPFRPIRVYISDGPHYEVRHPELMLVTRTEIIIALDSKNGDIPKRSVYCDPLHITRIEPINGKSTVRKKRRKK